MSFLSLTKLQGLTQTIRDYAGAELKAIQNAFLPSQNVAEQRRIETFGTSSKAVAGTAIVLGAAAAIAAPIVAASSTARTAIASAASNVAKTIGTTVVKTAVTHPLATSAAVVGGIPLIAGIVKENPKAPLKVAGAAYDIGSAVGKFINNNPTTAGLIAGGGLLAGGLAAAEIAANDTNITLPSGSSNNLPVSLTPQPSANQSGTPLLPATTTLKEVGAVKRRKSAKKKNPPQAVSVRVNNYMINDSYLKKSSYNY